MRITFLHLPDDVRGSINVNIGTESGPSKYHKVVESGDCQSQPIEETIEEDTEMWDVDSAPLAEGDLEHMVETLRAKNAALLAEEAAVRAMEEAFAPAMESDSKVPGSITSEEPQLPQREFRLEHSNPRKLHVENINYRTSQKKLWTFFSEFGEVAYCKLFVDHRRKSRGRGYVIYKDDASVAKVLELDEENLVLDKRTLSVKPFMKKIYLDEDPKCVTRRLPVEDKHDKEEHMEADDIETKARSNLTVTDHNYQRSTEEDGDIRTLNDHCLLHVFSFLSFRERLVCERVCKKWQQISHKVWNSTEHFSLENNVRSFGGCSDKEIRKLLKRGSYMLKSLDLSACPRHLGDATIDAICQYCPRLLHLNMSGMAITNRGVRKLAQKHVQLQTVHMKNCYEIGEKGIWWLFHKCKELKILSFDNNQKIHGQCFHVLGDNVQQLSLNKCMQLRNDAILKLLDHNKHLTELNLNECRTINDLGVQNLKQFPALTTLHFNGHSSRVSVAGMLAIAQIPTLEVLDISSNFRVDDSVLVALGRNVKNLRVLNISTNGTQLTDFGISALSSCHKLQTLMMNYAHSVTHALADLAKDCDLRVLEAKGCTRLDNDSLCQLASSATKLERADFSGCYALCASVLESFIQVAENKPQREITLVLGGTDLDYSGHIVPSNLHLIGLDFSVFSSPLDDDLSLYTSGDDYDSDGFDRFSDEFDSDYEVYLAGDDPLYEERFDMV